MEHAKKQTAKRQTEAKKRYDLEYHRTKTLSIAFRLSKEYDKDLIEIYKSIPDKSRWFKESLLIWQKNKQKA